MKKWYEMKAKGNQTADIQIYDEIGIWGITAKDFANDLKALGSDIKVLNVSLNSPGGSVIDGNAIYNSLVNHKARVNVSIDSVALSMGSVIAMAGDFIFMAENALMMIHNPFGMAMGDSDELRKTADVMDKMKNSLIKAYTRKTGKDAEELSALMDAETWMDADEALEAGFVDEITAAAEIAASFDLSKFDFKNTPKDFAKVENQSILDDDKTLADKEAKAIADADTMLAAVDKNNEEDIMQTEEQIKAAAEKAAAADKLIAEKATAMANEIEDNRKKEIVAIFDSHPDHKAVLQACLVDGKVTSDMARGKLLDSIGASSGSLAGDTRIETIADARDKFRAGALEAIAIRHGAAKDDGKNEMRGSTMLDLAKKSLEIAGFNYAGMDKMRIVAAAFTHSTSDFPYLLENSLGKELRNAYGAFAETWSSWCDIGSVPDFKSNSRIQMGSFNNLDVIPEGGEYTAGSFGEERELIQAETKGKMISLTRQMIINDDLGGFMRIAQAMGRAAARTVGNDVYTLLASNPLMNDGINLFDSANAPVGHQNIYGNGAPPSVSELGGMRTMMRKQRDTDLNDYLNIQPAYILCGVELEDTMNVLLASETDPSTGQNNAAVPNPIRNIAELITDPRLGANEYWMVASPNEAPLIEVAFLDGNQTPYLESHQGFTVDGTMWKVRMDYGLSAIDWRGGVYNDGVV